MTEATVATYAVKKTTKTKVSGKRMFKREFIRRFLIHVPPKRFVRIRTMVWLSCRNKSKKMTHCRNLLDVKNIFLHLKIEVPLK